MKRFLNRLVCLALTFSLVLSIAPSFAAGTDAEAEAERRRLKVYMDGREVKPTDAAPCIINDRTMVPIYMLTGVLGADVSWDAATQTATILRAATTIRMTIGSTTAYLDDTAVAMDVAPCILSDRTYIPAAYLAQFFGQIVTWDGATNTVLITEDKSVVGDSNLESWALPMGALLQQLNFVDVLIFGGRDRNDDGFATFSQKMLEKSWGIDNRENLVSTILSMTYSGHNSSFLYEAAVVNGLSASEYKALLANSIGMDAYMWPYTKQLSDKWGERGILCWDLFRMSTLVQWGYLGGYITYAEALVLLEPAATLLAENFSSWDEAYENYLDGYCWWARENVLDTDIWTTKRGTTYTRLQKDKGNTLFDETLFQTGVIPVPGLTIQDILDTL